MGRKLILFIVFCFSVTEIAAQQDNLSEAVRSGDIEKVKNLLNSGVAVSARDSQGRTALHEAAAMGNVQLFRLLVSVGGDTHAKDNRGVTPEFIVFHTQNTEVRNAMIRSFPKDTAPRIQEGPWTLKSAISHRQPTVVAMLLDMGVKVNAVDGDGNYPLDLAAQKGDLQIVQLLLSHGAEVNIQAKNGSFPIHAAALFGNTPVVQLLLDKRADINCKVAATGETPLYYAASFGRMETVKLLLERGADKSIANQSGLTPLAAALKAGQIDTANLLGATPAKR
jgi:ankyrin repeat protein